MKQTLARLAAGLLAVLLSPGSLAQEAPERSKPALIELAEEFYAWLDAHRPVEPFAVVRARRPPGWSPDWSMTAVQQRKVEYLQFQGRVKSLNTLDYDTADRIDAHLLGAAMERVHWQLEVLASWRRDPGFYLDQSLGSLFELLIQSPQPAEADVEELIRRLHRFPAIINAAKLGLDRTVPLLAEAAVARIGEVNARVDALQEALAPFGSEQLKYDFNVGIRAARQALTSYKDWLTVSQPRFQESAAIGDQRYRWFLGHVALIPDAPEALQVATEVALARARAQLAVTRHRFAEQPETSALESAERLIQMAQISQQELGVFLNTANLVTQSGQFADFVVTALPPSLAPIAAEGERMAFGLDGNFETQRYVLAQRDDAGYLEYLAWADPRLLIAWDGVPGRHAQFRAASSHPRQLRRRASGVTLSGGIALYSHEQVMEAGLYAFRPVSQLLALEFLRYRAALAHADVRLAGGDWSTGEAADFLAAQAGLRRSRAESELHDLLAYPGKAGAAFAAYVQVIRFLADAAGTLGEDFSLREFNDRLLENAHVPVALQRWEMLGLEDELDRLTEQRGRPATVPQ